MSQLARELNICILYTPTAAFIMRNNATESFNYNPQSAMQFGVMKNGLYLLNESDLAKIAFFKSA